MKWSEFAGGELELGMIWQSKKALDLRRDPRCNLHSVITDRNGKEGEFKTNKVYALVWKAGGETAENEQVLEV